VKSWLWRWGPAVAQMIVIFAASSLPDLRRLPGGVSDHAGHFAGYAILGALVLRAVAGARLARVTPQTAVAAWCLSTAYGMTDEFHQHFVHGRTPALDDLAADAMGAAAAIVVVLTAVAIRRTRNRAV
jgi:VanZ family protein